MKGNIVINEDGHVYLDEKFLCDDDENYYFQSIYRECKWEQRSIKMFGKEMIQPRLIAWCGDEGIRYRYSGNDFVATPWTEALIKLKKRVEAATDYSFNSALVNLYEHGEHSMSWHNDNEKELGENPVIASVSLGTSRKFQFKHIKNKQLINITLNGGSLLLMGGVTQHFWRHALPKQKKVTESRINITFRKVLC